MHRVLASLVAAAMWLTSASAAFHHVHTYADHDHADHHHGPASHAHATATHEHHADSQAPEDPPGFERCDPGEHAVPVVFTCVTPQPGHAPVPVAFSAIDLTPPPQAWCRVAPSDMRAHSPPRLSDAPLRAPPVIHPA